LIQDQVDIVLEAQTVRIFHGSTVVAVHARAQEPFARVIDPQHYAGLWRVPRLEPEAPAPTLAALGRALSAYADAIGGPS
jgi:hypothetical protein